MYVGFHLCIHDWCFQKGTQKQYTRCKEVSEDGQTCYNPTIRYGSTIGGYPTKYGTNNILEWCKQLFPNSIHGIATYRNVKPKEYIGSLFWCSKWDESNPHWCDWVDGKWKDSNLYQYDVMPSPLIYSVTCQLRETVTEKQGELKNKNWLIVVNTLIST